jgi:hypothetical protein
MGQHTDVLAVTDHFLERVLDVLFAQLIGPLLRRLGEGLLLGAVPGLMAQENRVKDQNLITGASGDPNPGHGRPNM